jgi:hypothetical protein
MSRPDRKRLVKHWIISWIALPTVPAIWASLGGFHEMDGFGIVLLPVMLLSFCVAIAAPLAFLASFVVKTPPFDDR